METNRPPPWDSTERRCHRGGRALLFFAEFHSAPLRLVRNEQHTLVVVACCSFVVFCSLSLRSCYVCLFHNTASYFLSKKNSPGRFIPGAFFFFINTIVPRCPLRGHRVIEKPTLAPGGVDRRYNGVHSKHCHVFWALCAFVTLNVIFSPS